MRGFVDEFDQADLAMALELRKHALDERGRARRPRDASGDADDTGKRHGNRLSTVELPLVYQNCQLTVLEKLGLFQGAAVRALTAQVVTPFRKSEVAVPVT